MATIIYTDGKMKSVTPANGKWFTLEEKQEIVGGNIEILPTREGQNLVINEEGKLCGLDVNLHATLLYAYGLVVTKENKIALHDIIVGPALYCTDEELSRPEE